MNGGLSDGFMLGGWKIWPLRNLLVGPDGECHVEPKTMEVLVALAGEPGQVVTREALLDRIWPRTYSGDVSLTRCISQLRACFGEERGNPCFIETIPKSGYRLIAPVSLMDSPAVAHADSRKRSKKVVWSAAAIVVLIGIWFVALQPSIDSRVSDVDHPNVIVRQAEKSLAVLPFVNTSGNAENEQFSDGLTGTLINVFGQLPDLKVIARTSAFFFKGRDMDVREIADELGVSTVLEGTVQQDGGKIRIVATLIDGETGFQLWTETYEPELGDIFDVQDDIANQVALALRVSLAGGARIETVGTDNFAAYEKYLAGLQQKDIGSNTSLLRAEILLRESLALDPDFYEANLELAGTYWNQFTIGEIRRAEANEYIIPLIGRLLEEQPDNGLALVLAGQYQGYNSIDINQHLVELHAAIEKTPSEPRLYRALADVLEFANRPEEAFELLNRGLEVDPFDWNLRWRHASYLWRNGQLDQAEAEFAKILEDNPGNASVYASAAVIPRLRKDYAEWYALTRIGMDIEPLDHEFPAAIAKALYTFGLMDEGDKYLQRAMRIAPDKSYVLMTRLYRLMLLGLYTQACQLSESMLRDDVGARFGEYFFAAQVFVSTMTEKGKFDDALEILEELHPGVSSPDFDPQNFNEEVLQYLIVLAIARTEPMDERLRVVRSFVSAWNDSPFVDWRPHTARVMAPIAMARGQTDIAIKLTIEDLERARFFGSFPHTQYRHIFYYKTLALEPVVAKRLKELDAEARKAGEDVWAYIVENKLQL